MTNEEINQAVAESFKAEQAIVKANRARVRAERATRGAIIAAAAVEAIALSARKIAPSTIALDVDLVLGDLLADRSKPAIAFDVIGHSTIVLSRALLRRVAAELMRTKRRGPITCTLGGGLTFHWRTGRLVLRDQEPKRLPGVGCKLSVQGLFCRCKGHLTPDNHLRVVIGGMQ